MKTIDHIKRHIKYTGDDFVDYGICAAIYGIALPVRLVPMSLGNDLAFGLACAGTVVSSVVFLPACVTLLVTGFGLKKLVGD